MNVFPAVDAEKYVSINSKVHACINYHGLTNTHNDYKCFSQITCYFVDSNVQCFSLSGGLVRRQYL